MTKRKHPFKTREQWLNALTKASAPYFKKAGFPIDDKKIRCAIGFTSKGHRGKRIGECWACEASGDGHFEVFITPQLETTINYAETHTHEIIHLAVGHDKKHGKVFKQCALSLGLEGKMTATNGGKEWAKWMNPILKKLGPLPHAKLGSLMDVHRSKSDGENRHVKCQCSECEIIFRMSRKSITGLDAIRCPRPECDGEVASN